MKPKVIVFISHLFQSLDVAFPGWCLMNCDFIEMIVEEITSRSLISFNPPAPRRGATRLRSICSILYIWPPFAMESYYSLAFFAFSHFGSSEGSISHFSCLMSQVLLDCLLYPKKHRIALKPLGAQDLGWPQNPMKIHQFSSQSPRQQKPWKLVPRLPKIMKNRPWNHEKSNFYRNWSLQYFPCQMHVFQSQTPKFRPNNQKKKQPGDRYEQICFFVQKYPNNFQNGSPKSSKNRQNPSLDPTGSFLVPSNVPGSSQDRPRVPQDAKVEAPSMPNDTHGHHKPENWLQKWQESSIQDPASQHTFQQRSLIKQKPTNENLPNQ